MLMMSAGGAVPAELADVVAAAVVGSVLGNPNPDGN
jgi:hypothetical protein